METLLSASFWLSLIYFVATIVLAFFIPGDLILGKVKIPLLVRLTLAIIVGMTLWAWQGFILGYFSLRFLTYVYLLVTFYLWFKKRWSLFQRELLRVKPPKDTWLIVLFVLGVLVQILPIWGNGLRFSRGIYFCCGNQLDNLFHFSLTQALVAQVPPDEPGMAGVLVKNYHYWFNLVFAELVRIFRLPTLPLLFQFASIFLSFFYGLVTVTLAQVLGLNRMLTRLFVFFNYFGADAIYALLAWRGNLSSLAAVSSLEDGSTFLLNPPRAASMVVALAGLTLLVLFFRQKKTYLGVLAMIVLSSTVGFKVYTAIFLGIGLGALLILALIKRKWRECLILSIFFPLILPIYLPTNVGAGGLFWAPFHFVNNFIVQPAFRLERWEMAREIFASHYNILRVLQYEFMFTVITLVALLGTKTIAFIQPWRSLAPLGKELRLFLATGIIGSLILGLFFLQKSGGANTFNFIVASFLFLSLPAALAAAYWINKFKIKYGPFLLFLLFGLTLPRIISNTYLTLRSYQKLDYLFLTNQELDGYTYLRDHTPPNSLVLVDAVHGIDNESPTVYGFTSRPMFLSGKGILASHGRETDKRTLVKHNIFRSGNAKLVAQELIENKIDYLLLWDGNKIAATESALFITPVFHNNLMTILAVDETKAREFVAAKQRI